MTGQPEQPRRMGLASSKQEEATVSRYYVQQSDESVGWKTVATTESREGAESLSSGLRTASNKRDVRAMSRSALVREGGVNACTSAEDDLEGLELEQVTLRMRR
jgi:hypothetical protein